MSSLMTIGKAVGTAALATLGPVGVAVAAAMNAYLGDDDKVGPTTSVADVDGKLDKLTEAQRADVMQAFYAYKTNEDNNDTESEMHRVDVMEASDRAGTSNRPIIALMMAVLMCVVLIGFCGVIGYISVVNKKAPDWELVSALLFLPVWVIQRHFHAEVQSSTVDASKAIGGQINLPMGTFGRLASEVINRKKGM